MKSSFLVAALLAAACGSKSPTSFTTPAPTASAATPVAKQTLPDVPFDQLDDDQKAVFMKQKVVPTMEPLFKQHDAKAFADFGCKTCHGEEADAGHYDMPNPKLPKLNFSDMSKYKPEDVAWMKQDIKPTMAKLLQMPEMTRDNPKGFGCLNCHVMEGQ